MGRSARKNAFYAQSGGVSAVINASACGVIETARKHRDRIGKLYAGRHGIVGALTEDLIDTGKESAAAIRGLRHTPGGAFGSARYKLAGLDKNRAQYERLIEVFRAHDIGYFFYNGGNDSMDTAHKVSEIGVQLGLSDRLHRAYPRPWTMTSPSPTAVPASGRRPNTSRCRPARQRSTCCRWRAPPPRCSCSRSWAATPAGSRRPAASPGERAGDAPHIILFPEIAFDRARFLDKVKTSVERYGYCVVVVSEGVRTPDGKFLAEAGTRDAFGHAQFGGVGPVVAQMTQEAFGYKFHWAVADYLQRSATAHRLQGGCGAGLRGRQGGGRLLALAGKNAVMPTIVRKSSAPYRWSIGEAPLAMVANQEKKVPRNFITEDGFGITAACRRYLLPLIGGEDYPPYRRGLPAYVSMKGVAVAKRLKSPFVI